MAPKKDKDGWISVQDVDQFPPEEDQIQPKATKL